MVFLPGKLHLLDIISFLFYKSRNIKDFKFLEYILDILEFTCKYLANIGDVRQPLFFVPLCGHFIQ